MNFVGGAATPPHTHAGAFVSVTVLSGSVFNKMNDDPLKVFKAGESFFEYPGCHHVVSENFSQDEEAVILATLIIDTEVVEKGWQASVVIDKEFLPST